MRSAKELGKMTEDDGGVKEFLRELGFSGRVEYPYQCSHIFGELYQGPRPPTGLALRDAGFHVLVLCADDVQPPDEKFPTIKVIRAPSFDVEDVDTMNECLPSWIEAAHNVANELNAEKRVLVTCWAGLNRSGMVSALALREITGWSGQRCVDLIQRRRKGALDNEVFVGYLGSLPPTDEPVQPVEES